MLQSRPGVEMTQPLPRAGAARVAPILILAVAAAVWLWFALTTHLVLEDAYITFRYAPNLTCGLGFVYNPGERVLGTTTPLQTLLLAGLGGLLGPSRIPTIAALLMPLFGLAAGGLMYSAMIAFGLPRVAAGAGAVLFLLHPLVIRTSVGGMETPLVLFLMALSLHFLARERAVAATAVGALLVLARADGLIWAGLVFGTALLARYRRPLPQLAALILVLLPWVVFAWRYFGSPIPNTMLAKGVVRPGRELLLLQPLHFRRLALWYLSGTGFTRDHPLFWAWVLLLAVGVFALLRARRRELLLLPVFPAVFAVLMYLGRAPMYQWYLLPILLCCLFLGGAGIGQIISWLVKMRVRWVQAAAALLALAVLLPSVGRLLAELPAQARHARLFQENEVGLRCGLGLWLRDHTPPEATVAMEAIGYQGYFSERRIIDMAGLITPQVVSFKARTGRNSEVFRSITTELRPDYLVLRSFEVEENRHFNGGKLFDTEADRARFVRQYRELRRFTAPHRELAPLVTHLTLYQRLR